MPPQAFAVVRILRTGGGTCRLPARPTRRLIRRLIRRPARCQFCHHPRRRQFLWSLLRRPPSAACGWSRFLAAGRPTTARYTGPRARAPSRTREYLDGRGGSGRRLVQAVRPGDRRNPGRRPVSETTRPMHDRTGPEPDCPAHSVPYPGSAAQDPAHRDVAADGEGSGDDRDPQLRAAKPRARAAAGACARPPARTRAARPSGPMALHRDRGRLALLPAAPVRLGG